MYIHEIYHILPSYQQWHIFRLLRIVRNKLPHELIYELLNTYFESTIRPYIFNMNYKYMCQDKFLPFIKYRIQNKKIDIVRVPECSCCDIYSGTSFLDNMVDLCCIKNQLDIMKYLHDQYKYKFDHMLTCSLNAHKFHITDWILNVMDRKHEHILYMIWYGIMCDSQIIEYFKKNKSELCKIFNITEYGFDIELYKFYNTKQDKYHDYNYKDKSKKYLMCNYEHKMKIER